MHLGLLLPHYFSILFLLHMSKFYNLDISSLWPRINGLLVIHPYAIWWLEYAHSMSPGGQWSHKIIRREAERWTMTDRKMQRTTASLSMHGLMAAHRVSAVTATAASLILNSFIYIQVGLAKLLLHRKVSVFALNN